VPHGGRVITFFAANRIKLKASAEKHGGNVRYRQPGSKSDSHDARNRKIRERKKSETDETREKRIEHGAGCRLLTGITISGLQHVPTEHAIVQPKAHKDEEAYCRKEISDFAHQKENRFDH
jgi:hypothetical protein